MAQMGRNTVLLFGSGASAAVRLLDSVSTADANDIAALVGDERVRITMAAPGRHMAENAMAVLATAAALGLDVQKSAASLTGFAPIGGRGARRRILVRGGEALLLDESYNASPAAVRAALSVLALQPAKRRIAVLGDMLELGDAGPAEHAALAPDVAAAADVLFTCGPLMRELFDAVPQSIRGAHEQNSVALAPVVADAVRPSDAVLVKGSLGSRMKSVVQALDGAARVG